MAEYFENFPFFEFLTKQSIPTKTKTNKQKKKKKAVAGETRRMFYDISSGNFELEYLVDTSISAPTGKLLLII